MQVTDQTGDGEPETGVMPSPVPGPRQSDNPPVGEPLVVSRRNPEARPPVIRTVSPTAAPTEDRRTSSPSDGTDRESGEQGSGEQGSGGQGSGEQGSGEQGTTVDVVPDRELPVPVLPMAGSTVLVSASGGPVGAAVARELDSRGARVLLLDADPAALLATLDSLPPGHAVPLLCDVGSERDVSSVVEFVVRATRIDAIVHVAVGAEDPDPDDPGPDDTSGLAARDLARQLRSLVLSPIELVDGLGEALVDAAPVVLVRDAGPASVLGRVAPEMVRERIGSRCRVCDVERDDRLSPERFAEVILDLMTLDDVAVEHLVLVGHAAGAAPGTSTVLSDDSSGSGSDGGAGR